MTGRRSALFRQLILPLSLFVLALAVRAPGLSGFVTIDEPRWINRARWFTTGLLFPEQECPKVAWGRDFATQGLACTFQIGYPGVTTMWAGSLGLLTHYWRTAAATGADLHTFLTRLSIVNLDPAIIAPTRLPLAIIGALFVLYFFLLLRRLLTARVALIAALMVALHPFHIGLSRVLHHDALTTTFMVTSLLALMGYWLQGWSWYWLPLSAGLAGLAFLSKQVSWFLPPFVALLAGLTLYYRWQKGRWHGWRTPARLAGEGITWAGLAGMTFVILFPAMWVIPGEVIRVIFTASTTLAAEGHTHYFLGQVTKNPGLLFYPVGWLLRATPPEVLGLLAVGLAAGRCFIRRSVKKQIFDHPVEVALALFVILLFLFVNISDKKLVRYFLPAFPVIDVFAALGLLWLFDNLTRLRMGAVRRWDGSRASSSGLFFLVGLILLVQGWLVQANFPYYLTYYNPLAGGMPGAARFMTLVGWGEGLNEAAGYLNEQPQAASLQVVTERFCSVFRPFFVGKVTCLNSTIGGILRADYLVYYFNVVQRRLAWPEQWHYFQAHYPPAYRLNLGGLDYVLVYRNPIQHQVDRQANSLNGVFKTFGYNLSPQGELTLFWQNLGLGERQLMLGLAPAQGDSPVGAPPSSADRRWIACSPAPAFAAEASQPKAVIESICPLGDLKPPAGLYDLQLAVGHDAATINPIDASLLALLRVDATGFFESVNGAEPAAAVGQ